jgi:putative heme transporter
MSVTGDRPTPAGGDGSLRASSRRERIRRWGQMSWAILGIVGVLVVSGYAVTRVPLVVVPLLLALFPATLLFPVVAWLRRRDMHDTLAALLTVFVFLVLMGGVGTITGSLITSGLPGVLEGASDGLQQLERLLQRVSPQLNLRGWDDVLEMGQNQFVDGEMPSRILRFTTSLVEIVAGILLMIVILYFYLRNGPEMVRSLACLAPPEHREKVLTKAGDAWDNLGAFFRGQMLIALVDAVFIGVGLLILRIPMAVPLAILVFFGGLFPIVGAVISGMLAVLVALAHGGLGLGLGVAGLVLAVQQLESNVLEPLILSGAIDLHPLVIILSITAGSVLLGVLGAFLAVPVATVLQVILTSPESRKPH